MTQAPIPHKMLSKHNLKAMPDLNEQGVQKVLLLKLMFTILSLIL